MVKKRSRAKKFKTFRLADIEDLDVLIWSCREKAAADLKRRICIPIVFLTGISERDRVIDVVKLKPQGFLLKPIDRGNLLDKIDSLIG